MIFAITDKPEDLPSRCGYVALAGRPNVGKSTLLNALLGRKLSITSRKPQTTRQSILGIKSCEKDGQPVQFIFVDTPGLHQEGREKVLNRAMNRAASGALKDVDCIVWVVDATRWTTDDEFVAKRLQQQKHAVPVMIALNKIDLLKQQEKQGKKSNMLYIMQKLTEKFPEFMIVPISAEKGRNLVRLEEAIFDHLPENPFFFAPSEITDRSHKFIAAEFIREKLVRSLGQELPYATAVSIESWEVQNQVLHIQAIIWVEKPGQKGIVIGDAGVRLKIIGRDARLAMEKYFNQKVFLTLWVKVKDSWSEDARIVNSFLE